MTTYQNGDRPSLVRLHEAVYSFTSAERQLSTRYKRTDSSLSPGRLRALNVLLRGEGGHRGSARP